MPEQIVLEWWYPSAASEPVPKRIAVWFQGSATQRPGWIIIEVMDA